MATPDYPLKFYSRAQSAPEDPNWTTRPEVVSCGLIAAARPLDVQIPSEFGGPVRETKDSLGFDSTNPYTPEDLFGMALVNCFIATFRVFSQNSKITYQDLCVRVAYTIDLNERKLPQITELDFDVTLRGAEKKDRAERLLKRVSQNCLIINSVQADMNFTFKVTEKQVSIPK